MLHADAPLGRTMIAQIHIEAIYIDTVRDRMGSTETARVHHAARPRECEALAGFLNACRLARVECGTVLGGGVETGVLTLRIERSGLFGGAGIAEPSCGKAISLA